MTELTFDSIAPLEIPVTIAEKKYLLREPTADADCRYRSALMRGTRFSADGKQATAEGNAEAELLLISLCLVEKFDSGGVEKERPVPLVVVKGWPARIHQALFEQAEKLRPKKVEETADELERRLEETQERLAELRNGNGDHAGNLHGGLTATSGSQAT